MNPTRVTSIAAATAVVAIVAGLLVGFSAAETPDGEPQSRPVVMTEFPGLEPAQGDPQLPGLAELSPAAGTAEQTEGPFDDRFTISGLAFDGDSVSGTLLVTSDVSEVIELEVVAGFYDAGGALLGTGDFVLKGDHDEAHVGPPEESHSFEVPVPAELTGRAVSAAVGVPVLVNE